MVKKNISV